MDVGKLGKGLAIAEEQRDKRRHNSFIGDSFLGIANFLRFLECPEEIPVEEQRIADDLLYNLKGYLCRNVDPEKVDATNELPEGAIEWLCEHGYFGLKIPREYGGMGLHQTAYSRVLGVAASWSGGLAAPLSAANTIGLSYPILHYGADEQKKKWLPIVAKVVTGFAFTEDEAGSDPANMKTTATRVKGGYLLNGTKWWTTNGPMSDTKFLSPLLCVIAKTVDSPDELQTKADDKTYKPSFSALIVPTDAPGIRIVQRCDFAGLKGIYNGITEFKDVFVPADQLIGKEGLGFRIAIEALNTGRLSIASLCIAAVKQVLLMGNWYGRKRKQWATKSAPSIGYHEMVGSGFLAKGAANTLAAEAMVYFASLRVDNGLDARLEAAVCKVFSSERGWETIDDMMQLRGGRGYETAASLAKRGEPALPLERIWRDFRVNRVFEGASEILILWLLREGSDEYKKRGEVFFGPGNWWKKFTTAMGFAWSILKLQKRQPIPDKVLERIDPRLHAHLYFVEKHIRKLALSMILISAKYREKLIHKQLIFKRLFWIASELYAMSAICFYACPKRPEGYEITDERNLDLADYYCKEAQARIKIALQSLNQNSDSEARAVAKRMLAGENDEWLKKDIAPIVDHLGLK